MSADTCVRPTKKNKSEKNRSQSRSLPLAPPLCLSLTRLDPLLSVSLNESCDFLPVVLTLGSVCLRVSVTTPQPTTAIVLIKHNLNISVCCPSLSPTTTNKGRQRLRDRAREVGLCWIWLNFRGTQPPCSAPLNGAPWLTFLSVEDGQQMGGWALDFCYGYVE